MVKGMKQLGKFTDGVAGKLAEAIIEGTKASGGKLIEVLEEYILQMKESMGTSDESESSKKEKKS